MNISRSIVYVQLNVRSDVDVLNTKLLALNSALEEETVTVFENQNLFQNIASL